MLAAPKVGLHHAVHREQVNDIVVRIADANFDVAGVGEILRLAQDVRKGGRLYVDNFCVGSNVAVFELLQQARLVDD